MPAKPSQPLEDYRRKRDFQRTPEPQPKRKASSSGCLYVVQKHRAQQLHYDFRLELDGVLLSWAVPKGPSLDPAEKRLAVQTEDHPIEYGDFEGVIPEEEYGGGTVMLWDRGQWSPLSEPRAALDSGTLKFTIQGQKLRGAWTLVRIKEKGLPTRNWLLIKERDDQARSEESFSVIDEEPFSAASGRTIGEIASAMDRVWTGGGAQGAAHVAPVVWRRGLCRRLDLGAGELQGAKKSRMPSELIPVQAKLVERVPEGDGWLHEVLQHGHRVFGFLDEKSVILRRDRDDWAFNLPEIARAIGRLPVSRAILDGVIDPGDGEENQLPANTAGLIYHVFDLLSCDALDLRAVPLIERKRLLQKLLAFAEGPIAYCDHIEGRGDLVLAEARRLGAPGIVSKLAISQYSQRQGDPWRVVSLYADQAGAHPNPSVAAAGAKAMPPAPAKAGTKRRGQADRDPALADEPNEAGASQGTQRPLKARRPRVAAPELQIAVAGVKLTHPDRILYPEERVNKRMLAEYYEAVAPAMLPHLQNRPLSIYRCPGGIEKESFFQKQLGEMSSPYLRGAKAGDDPYLVLDGAAGLVTLAQWSTLEIHGWGCREPDLDHPDLIVFDLDPGPNVPWPQIVEGAKGLRLLLDELGLHSFVKTSGGKGLHVVVPLSSNQRSSLTKGGRIDESAALPRTKRAQSRVSETTASSADRGGRGVLGSRPGSPPPADPPTLTQDWDVVKDFAARVSRKITQVAPKHFTVFMSKPERRGKVFIDYHRNHRGSTCVMPYSTRARPGAFVSTPLDWSELDGPQPRFHIFDVLERLENRQGSTAPWSDFFQIKQGITPDALEWLRAGRRDS